MTRNKFGMVVTGALVLGLVACNNNGALDRTPDNNGPVGVTENVNYNGRDISTRYDTNEFPRRVNYDENKFIRDRDLNVDHIDRMDISNLQTDVSSKNYPHTKAILVQDAKFNFVQAGSAEEAKQKAQTYLQQAEQQARDLVQQGRGQVPNQQQAQPQVPAKQQVPNQQQAQPQVPAKQQAPNQQQTQPQVPAKQQAPTQQQAKAPAEKKPETQQPAQGLSQVVQQAIELTNAERRKNGLPDLKSDTQLSGVAQKKSEDMRQNNYFSHTSPTYGSPFDMMRDFGVTYKTAGENIAQGQKTPQQVVQAWMNSEGHRKNILSKDFTHIGIGYDQNGHHWTQMFIGK